jgi:DNA-binding CsgD family transcriptional regulator
MEELRRARRLVGVHGTVCLRDPKAPIPLPDGHELLAVLDAHGDVAREIVLLAASAVGLSVDEIPLLAAATGRVCADYGHAADQLVLAGILDSDLPGRLRCRHPALVAAVVARAGSDALRQLHRVMAEQLLDIQAQDGCRAPLLAGHVAGAGRALPQRPDLVELLRDEGLRLELTEQSRYSEHLYAAWWHAGPGEERGLLRWELIQLFVRTGRYEELAAYVAEELESGAGSEEHAELAAAAVLAAVHLGRPVPASIRERLAVEPAGPLDFAERWFDGEPIRPEDFMASFGRAWPFHDATLTTIAGHTRRLAQPDERIAAASAVRDLVPVFEAVLGSAYRAPEDGPVAAYHRLCAGYVAADWEGALSAARELELCPDADAFAVEHARLLAAEMCAWRGENRRATAWLESVPEGGCLPVLRGWVATGLLDHAGDPAAAAEHGWAVYQEHADDRDELALDRLLLRLAWIAEHDRQPYASRRALAEAEARRKRAASPRSLETASLIRALVNADNAAVRVAEQLVRPRGEGFDLVLLALIAGRISGAPHGWLREAYDVSQTIGAARLVALAKCSMDRHGVAAPATRTRPAELSSTELHIIDLIRQGRTNRQIADTIRIGEKTVEKHLTRLFVKAGCRTRHGLATSGLGRPQESVGA